MVRARTGERYTKTEEAIVELLSDGNPHCAGMMHEMFCGPTRFQAIATHIVKIRKKLPAGTDIVCRPIRRKSYYQMVRLIASANNGRS